MFQEPRFPLRIIGCQIIRLLSTVGNLSGQGSCHKRFQDSPITTVKSNSQTLQLVEKYVILKLEKINMVRVFKTSDGQTSMNDKIGKTRVTHIRDVSMVGM